MSQEAAARVSCVDGSALVGAAAAFVPPTVSLEVEVHYSERCVDLVAEGFDASIRVGVLSDSRLIARIGDLCSATARPSHRGNSPRTIAWDLRAGFLSRMAAPGRESQGNRDRSRFACLQRRRRAARSREGWDRHPRSGGMGDGPRFRRGYSGPPPARVDVRF